MVLAFGTDIRLCTLLSPDSPELRMKRKAGFIFKQHHSFTVSFSGAKELFLPHLEIRLLPRRWLEHIDTSVDAKNCPVSLSCAGRVALGSLCNGIFSSTRQPQRRPSDSWIDHSPEATWTTLHQVPSVLFRQIEKVCRAEDDPQSPQGPPDWLSESTSPSPRRRQPDLNR